MTPTERLMNDYIILENYITTDSVLEGARLSSIELIEEIIQYITDKERKGIQINFDKLNHTIDKISNLTNSLLEINKKEGG